MALFNKPIGLELFPARTKTHLKEVLPIDSTDTGVGRAGGYNPKDKMVKLPTTDTAWARTIRLHEALHTIYSPDKVAKDRAGQIAEDMRLHARYAHAQGSVRRDEKATALKELRWARQMVKNPVAFKLDKASAHDVAVGATERAAAILSSELQGNLGKLPEIQKKALTKTFETIKNAPISQSIKRDKHGRAVIGKSGYELDTTYSPLHDVETPKILELTQEALVAAKRNETNRAAKILRDFFANPSNPPDRAEMPQQGDGEGMMSPTAGFAIPEGYDEGEQKIDPDQMELMDELSEQLPSCEERSQYMKLIHSGAVKYPEMKINNLAMQYPRLKGAATPRMSVAGMKIRAKKLASAAISPCPGRVFEKRVHQKGGSVVIDASGSMSLSDKALIKIADSMPAGKVAYYSGSGAAAGDMVIYADKGKQFNPNVQGGEDVAGAVLPYRHGGNAVDYTALKWLLEQPAPRYFITDGEFCGAGVYDEETRVLLDYAVRRNLVKWYKNLDTLKNKLGIGKKKSVAL